MTFFFSRFGGCGLPTGWAGAGYGPGPTAMNLIRTYRSIWSLDCEDDGSPEGAAQGGLAEYHFRKSRDGEKQDAEMKRLYELHHGKI